MVRCLPRAAQWRCASVEAQAVVGREGARRLLGLLRLAVANSAAAVRAAVSAAGGPGAGALLRADPRPPGPWLQAGEGRPRPPAGSRRPRPSLEPVSLGRARAAWAQRPPATSGSRAGAACSSGGGGPSRAQPLWCRETGTRSFPTSEPASLLSEKRPGPRCPRVPCSADTAGSEGLGLCSDPAPGRLPTGSPTHHPGPPLLGWRLPLPDGE